MNNTTLPARIPLNEASWQGIQKVAMAGKANEYWKVGDTKTILLNGRIAGTPFTNFPVEAFILGFDHNGAVEGWNRIHFGLSMKDGNPVGLRDRHYGDYNKGSPSQNAPAAKPGFRMNLQNTNAGGWEHSYMRTQVLGSHADPRDPVKGTLLAALPRSLRQVMCSVPKYTDNTGNKSSDKEAVTCTLDSLWLPAHYEMYGIEQKNLPINTHEQEKQATYDYFKKNPGVIYCMGSPKKASMAWLRSPSHNSLGSDSFFLAQRYAIASNSIASQSLDLFACFAV